MMHIFKNKLLTIFLLLLPTAFYAQDEAHLFVLKADSSWSKELFKFPIGFAQDIQYEGIEDARFPVGWGKKDSSTFWSYVFAWHIKLDSPITEHELESNLQIYFDGLMSGRASKMEALQMQATSASLVKTAGADGMSRYLGKLQLFDAFFAKKPMTLYVKADEFYCATKRKAVVIFRFSPKGFGDGVWLKLDEVGLRGGVCDL